jgi:hypothetical protein
MTESAYLVARCKSWTRLAHAETISKLAGSWEYTAQKDELTAERMRCLNPRFSNLAAASAACGFRDVEWSPLIALGLRMQSRTPPLARFRYQRFLSDAMDHGGERQKLHARAPRSYWPSNLHE